MSSNRNIFLVTGPLWGESTGDRSIPFTKALMLSFDVFFDLRLNKLLSKQSIPRWFETTWCSLWHHRNICINIFEWLHHNVDFNAPNNKYVHLQAAMYTFKQKYPEQQIHSPVINWYLWTAFPDSYLSCVHRKYSWWMMMTKHSGMFDGNYHNTKM